ncbi:hypothetical protein VTL71DRAFT_10971 [Oculimacula yallundae]|uniref:Major facilitator superfamily (MFS) profile domain-containing protein n=1 Tax=Oculimacula yallundae TaxID=86028 RepID=A0ABR4CUX4_9HELO
MANIDHEKSSGVGSSPEKVPLASPSDTDDNDNRQRSSDEQVEASNLTLGTPDEAAEDPNYLHGARLVLLTVTLMLGQFVLGIDATIITSALPTITAEFDSPFDVGWYGSAYLLTTIALQPTFGKIYMYFNVKITFIVSVLIFELGSVVCAIAKKSETCIVGRALAGVGQASMLAGGMIVIGYRIPLKRRALYFAVLTSMNGVASVMGPPIGGVFTDIPKLTWRFCFWINLPLGALSVITGLLCFESPAGLPLQMLLKQKLAKLDIGGAILMISGMTCLFLALQKGGAVYLWSDSRVWGCLLGFVLITGAFIALEICASIPPKIISQRTIFSSGIFAGLVSIGLSTHTYFLPFYFQAAKGLSAEASGLRLVPYLGSIMISSLGVGLLLMLVGYPVPLMWSGVSLFAIGSGLLATLDVNSSAGSWIGFQLLTGFGFGSTVNLAAVVIQAALPAEDLPIGNSLLLFFNFLGGALGVSIAQVIYSNVLKDQLGILVPDLDVSTVISAGATNIRTVVPKDLIPLVREAYSNAVSKVFLLPIAGGCLAFLFTFGIRWKNITK